MKFIIRLKPDMSFILDAKARPKLLKVVAIRIMNTRDMRIPRHQ